jgi:hypothetical protein
MITSLPHPGISNDLKRTVEATGGGFAEFRKDADIDLVVSTLLRQIMSQYVATFTPTARDGKRHELTYKTTRRGVKIQARQAYQSAR